MRRLDPDLPIYSVIGLGHWAVFKNADENPKYPWFAEHRICPHPADLRRPHDEENHEYGSFATFDEAIRAAADWAEPCHQYEIDFAEDNDMRYESRLSILKED